MSKFFFSWFELGSLSAGDWPFLFSENIKEFAWPFATRSGGLPPLDFYFQLTAKVLGTLGLSWAWIERLVWFWPFLLLSVFSAFSLAKALFPDRKLIWWLAPLIYLFNTYILMVAGGGQMGVALAYALSPLTLTLLISQKTRFQPLVGKIIGGVILSLQMMFDPRLALLTILMAMGYYLAVGQSKFKSMVARLAIPTLITSGIHLIWVGPALWKGGQALPINYTHQGWLDFLSFATFSNSISLLHPNWPENIFGKVYFMRPEFLIIPMVAFSSVLLVQKDTVKRVAFLAMMGLLGAFLAKGIQPPLGEVYLWLFQYLPGFNLFRDPTKFYLLVAISYSLLIPFTLKELINKMKNSLTGRSLLVILLISFWFLMLQPAWKGQLTGTFQAKPVPDKYVELKNYLVDQNQSFGVLWMPIRQRFGFSSQSIPAIESDKLLDQKKLTGQGIKYLIIPFDSEQEIFLEDRKYSSQQRLEFDQKLSQVDWLRPIEGFGEISVYQVAPLVSD